MNLPIPTALDCAIIDQFVQHLDRDDNSSIQPRQKTDGFNENQLVQG
ncbi:MAG TPA: hypothetical protein VKJ01_12015 [Candidatus Solibacter sp.]|nr:hypothetical protein [Candidatus Solibacter sp.]